MSVFHGLILALVFFVNVHAQDPGTSCVPEIKVRKNTVYRPFRDLQFNISCPVTYCNETPVVGWMKIDDRNNFLHINKTNEVTILEEQTGLKEIISYLIFKNISPGDNAIYRCKVSTKGFSSESHSINLTVSGGGILETTVEIPTAVNTPQVSVFSHVFLCLGILLVLLTVMLISFLSKCRYACSSKSASNLKTEYTTVVYTLTPFSPDISTCDA